MIQRRKSSGIPVSTELRCPGASFLLMGKRPAFVGRESRRAYSGGTFQGAPAVSSSRLPTPGEAAHHTGITAP